jgi:hypothetical protein
MNARAGQPQLPTPPQLKLDRFTLPRDHVKFEIILKCSALFVASSSQPDILVANTPMNCTKIRSVVSHQEPHE